MNIAEFNSRLVLSSEDNLFIFNKTSGSIETIKVPPPNIPRDSTSSQFEVLNRQERTINSIAISKNGQLMAIATENKQVVVFNDHFKVAKNFIVNRSASKILFTSKGNVLVADRTGDVYLYNLSDEKTECVLLLGHLSMILDMALSECEKYIITCDRDEKIRVSHFPNTYNIVSFCLGHEQFITSIKVVNNVLFSASGDGTVRIWNFLNGEQLNMINVNNYIDPSSLEHFSLRMQCEQVDVTAVPITDMQVQVMDGFILIILSLYNDNRLQLYKVETTSYRPSYIKNINCYKLFFKFYLANDFLLVFDEYKVSVYRFVDEDFSVEANKTLEEFYDNFKDNIKLGDSDGIMMLYKKSYDNVQEYLERKRLRLEANK